MMWSEDNGKTFTKSKVFIAEEGFRNANRPYVKYYSDGKSRIHFIFTDGHPRDEPVNLCIMPIMSKVLFGELMGLKYVIFRTYHLNPKMLL